MSCWGPASHPPRSSQQRLASLPNGRDGCAPGIPAPGWLPTLPVFLGGQDTGFHPQERAERLQGTPLRPPTLARDDAAGGGNLRRATRPVVSGGKPHKIQLGMAEATIPTALGVAWEHLGCQSLYWHRTPLVASSCGHWLFRLSVTSGSCGSAAGPVQEGGGGGANTEEESSQFALSTPPARDRDTVSYPREAPDRMEAACPLPQASQSSRRLRAKFCSNEGDRAPLDGSGIERESGRPFSDPLSLAVLVSGSHLPKQTQAQSRVPAHRTSPTSFCISERNKGCAVLCVNLTFLKWT